ncbi:hypothetical protein NADFUDRAFT_66618 [Nadsonia fulvescens var. elongata DSM 6958]|uniref:Mif2/CENP-C cupin domain-containing protein n=1 Tax=Nadsonia fulvescens var. elongata DSM 6958 TaxID=857566 RepID=A0A1E3PGL1_9ASCO|nr:hypothetical protein NADFUDRAFT_66618 [Nadsonia fulvescens var. elongata DSM 6958]
MTTRRRIRPVENTRSTTSSFFEIAEAGRRTGLKITDSGARDEFGMESMDAYFNSDDEEVESRSSGGQRPTSQDSTTRHRDILPRDLTSTSRQPKAAVRSLHAPFNLLSVAPEDNLEDDDVDLDVEVDMDVDMDVDPPQADDEESFRYNISPLRYKPPLGEFSNRINKDNVARMLDYSEIRSSRNSTNMGSSMSLAANMPSTALNKTAKSKNGELPQKNNPMGAVKGSLLSQSMKDRDILSDLKGSSPSDSEADDHKDEIHNRSTLSDRSSSPPIFTNSYDSNKDSGIPPRAQKAPETQHSIKSIGFSRDDHDNDNDSEDEGFDSPTQRDNDSDNGENGNNNYNDYNDYEDNDNYTDASYRQGMSLNENHHEDDNDINMNELSMRYNDEPTPSKGKGRVVFKPRALPTIQATEEESFVSDEEEEPLSAADAYTQDDTGDEYEEAGLADEEEDEDISGVVDSEIDEISQNHPEDEIDEGIDDNGDLSQNGYEENENQRKPKKLSEPEKLRVNSKVTPDSSKTKSLSKSKKAQITPVNQQQGSVSDNFDISEDELSQPAPVRSRERQPIKHYDGGLRRSNRIKIKPLDYWRNERVVYCLDKMDDADSDSPLIPEIREIIKLKPPVEKIKTMAHKRKPKHAAGDDDGSDNETGRRTTKNRRRARVDISSGGSDSELEPGIGEFTIDPRVDAVVFDYPNVEIPGGGFESTQRTIAWSAGSVAFEPVKNNSYKLATLFDADSRYAAGGVIALDPKGVKPMKGSRKNHYFFHVVKGAVEVNISDNIFHLKRGGSFEVSRGNYYSITNRSKGESQLFFVQTTDTLANAQLDRAE